MSLPYPTAVITGASTGIGRELAKELARQGVRVGVTARRTDKLAELVAEVRACGGTIEAASADVADRSATAAAIRSLADRLGPVDLLVANAGVALPSNVGPDHVAAVEHMARVNYLGVVYSFDTVLTDMISRGSGHLVAVASMASYKGLPGSAGYCASKAAVRTYCEALRIELADRGVAVTCVFPGFIRTPMTATNTNPMPWLMDADAAARRIVRALPRRPGVYDFPKRMRILMWLAKWAPDRFIARRVPIRIAATQSAESPSRDSTTL